MKDKIKTLYRLDEQECQTLNMAYIKPQIYMNSAAVIALCRNGSIMVIHNPLNYDFSGWESVTKVSCGKAHLVGLRSDGTVVAVGDDSAGQCGVSDWRDVADIAAYDNMTVGLSASGEAFIAGRTVSPQPAADNSPAVEDSCAGVKTPANTSIQENVSGTIRDSWDEIIANINNGTYADKYKIGDTKALDLGSEGVVEMQIVAFNADELAEGGGTAAITWISKQLLKTPYHMNPPFLLGTEGTGSHGGWKKSEMRNYLKDIVKSLIPKAVQDAIKSVKKYSSIAKIFGYSKNSDRSIDDVWIPSFREVDGTEDVEKLGPKYSIVFSDDASRIKMDVANSATWWWLRSSYNRSYFIGIGTDGSYYYSDSCDTGGVALGFCT